MKVYRPLETGQVPDYSHTVPVVIPEALEKLASHRDGVLALPIRLDWTPANSHDLSDRLRVRTLYATMLREAATEDGLHRYLHARRVVHECAWHNDEVSGHSLVVMSRDVVSATQP
ncbi:MULTISPECIES: hypothetical protein [Auritidibacter]|uniref:Uncharacterized protein n=1 Tax=Auritidibacter ignavus TaxID=678932 RepID=A0AAJ6AIR6_9MICC|nr:MULTISPECIES: hypothetical protein [Auritidibacter]AXR74661.1 hypothetical protein DCC27_010475 [Auritidibacter sp. NML130574]NIH71050.1 hypothetical protein [Auritidibacter ignavus]RMX22997.1 hypothetical protein DYI20_07140 [Auritidibacter ignavus]WGH81198.1 hypothetical protein QDX25_10465 [Auritidibacter ignavus]WGH83121.1 hypothetical protein QDX20_07495 [Auritidibacter ignavus]